MSQFTKINDNFAVSAQISASALEVAAKEGFHAVICNRPDNEDADQPTHAEIARSSTRAGLAFHAVPFDMSSLDRGVIDAFESAVQSANGPILAYCRSGTRSTIAWCVLERRSGTPLEDVLNMAQQAGYDLHTQASLIESLV